MMRRVLIAGGAGFIGANLCRRMLDLGDEVVCFDDLSTGRHTNVAELVGGERFTFVAGDVCDSAALPTGTFDVVVNLASPASPPAYLARPIATLRAGSVGCENLIHVALASDAVFVHASTSEVYGDPLEHPQTEAYWGHVNPVGPRSVYDEAKRFGEALCSAYEREHGLRLRLPRLFNTYGPRMQPDDGRVITNFVIQALRGEPLTVYGDGMQTRSFCYVDDLLDALLTLMLTAVDGPINIGNPGEFTMLELADLVRELTGSRVPVVFGPLPADDPTQRRPDITRARTLLGWEPQVPLRDGLTRTIAWFRQP
jgi:nucleoside-diphosphate-sugar epimerase